jgi:hypothetical protein
VIAFLEQTYGIVLDSTSWLTGVVALAKLGSDYSWTVVDNFWVCPRKCSLMVCSLPFINSYLFSPHLMIR